jgi:hypothetical protein
MMEADSIPRMEGRREHRWQLGARLKSLIGSKGMEGRKRALNSLSNLRSRSIWAFFHFNAAIGVVQFGGSYHY